MLEEVLTDHQASLVERLVACGRLEALRAAAQVGVADIEAGRFKTFDSKASLRSHLEAVASQAKPAP